MPVMNDRKSGRLPNYDYSSNGGYFLTFCGYQKQFLFGKIENEEMLLSRVGAIVKEEWTKTGQIRPDVQLDEFIIMPDHFHAILLFTDSIVGTYGHTPLLGMKPSQPYTSPHLLERNYQ